MEMESIWKISIKSKISTLFLKISYKMHKKKSIKFQIRKKRKSQINYFLVKPSESFVELESI